MGIRRFITFFLLTFLAAAASCAQKRIVLRSPDGSSAEYTNTTDSGIEGLKFAKKADGSVTLEVTKSDQNASAVNEAMWAFLAELARRIPVVPVPAAASPTTDHPGIGPTLAEASR